MRAIGDQVTEELMAAIARSRERLVELKRKHAGEIDAIIAGISAREDTAQVAEIKKSLGIG